MAFDDRAHAGRCLARRLTHLQGSGAVVLGLARGGMPVAYEVARALAMPLDVVVAQRIEDPFMPGLTVGAVAEGGVTVVDPDALRRTLIRPDDLAEITAALEARVERRARRLRAGRAPIPLTRRTAVVVDDGVATATTARAGCRAVRARGPDRVVLAVPVAAMNAVVDLENEVEEIVCVETPAWMVDFRRWYRDFPVTTDEDVAASLADAAIRSPYRDPRAERFPARYATSTPAA